MPKYGDMAYIKSEIRSEVKVQVKSGSKIEAKSIDVDEAQPGTTDTMAKAAMGGMMQNNVLNNCTMNFNISLSK